MVEALHPEYSDTSSNYLPEHCLYFQTFGFCLEPEACQQLHIIPQPASQPAPIVPSQSFNVASAEFKPSSRSAKKADQEVIPPKLVLMES